VSLLDVDELVFVGNLRHEGLRMHASDYVAIEEPLIGSFAVPIATTAPLAIADRRVG
jgi:hypothetical protein